MSMTSDFFDGPLDFAKEHAVCPPSYIEGYKGKDATTLDTKGYKGIGPNPERPVGSIRYARVMSSKKIGYIELFDDMRPGGGKMEDRNDEGAGVVRMKSAYSTFGEAKPIYFLPWDESGAIIKLHLPTKGRHVPDPDVFFTAAINGCSVFVQGDPTSPTVYHAGGNTGRSDHNDAARFWRHALVNHIKNSDTAQARGKLQAEVNKTDYVRTPGTQSNSSTPTADKYEQELKDRLNKKGSFTVTMVSPWGCVFGVRTGNNWEFYLQENGTVVCNYVTKAGVRTVSYARPMKLNKIFPGGTSNISAMSLPVPVTIS
jgi:hypothetical protein